LTRSSTVPFSSTSTVTWSTRSHHQCVSLTKAQDWLLHANPQQQAFEGLEVAGRKVRRPDCTLATTDHVSITRRLFYFQDPHR
jgi:homoaconitase/3-isopropylmalate dehydratase large subunit